MKFKYRLSASLPADTLRRVLDALELEEHNPFRASVRKLPAAARKGGKTHLITIENNDREYFANVLGACK